MLSDHIEEELERLSRRLKPGERLMYSLQQNCVYKIAAETGGEIEIIHEKQAYCHLCGGTGRLFNAKTWFGDGKGKERRR